MLLSKSELPVHDWLVPTAELMLSLGGLPGPLLGEDGGLGLKGRAAMPRGLLGLSGSRLANQSVTCLCEPILLICQDRLVSRTASA